MNLEKSIVALNSLIDINRDRAKVYLTASKEALQEDVLALFSGFRHTSEKCITQLEKEIRNLTGMNTNEADSSQKAFRIWTEVESSLVGKDHKTILDLCEYGEDVTLDTYEKVLLNYPEDITTHQRILIHQQNALIKADQDLLKTLH